MYFNLGSVLFQQGRIDQAIAQWQKALAIRPRDAEAHRNLASALRKQGNVKGAIAEYEQALNITPDDRVALNNLAWILATSSDASMRDGARAVTLASEGGAGLRGQRSKLRSHACRCACRGWTIRRSRRDSGNREGISQHNQNKPELASNLQEEIALYRARLALRE